MIISEKTIEILRDLVNEKTEYRTGSKLVALFNKYGFSDSYGQGFPSRGSYTESRLKEINGTPELDKCIKDIFSPINFVDRYTELDKLINDFNKYLSFDGWMVIRKNQEILITKANVVNIDVEKSKEIVNTQTTETDFLNEEFKDINVLTLPIESAILPYIEIRMKEIRLCMEIKSSLSTIFLIGSTLEGILLGVASKKPALYNQAKSAPKDNKTGAVLDFSKWSLSNFIDVSFEVGFIKEDVKKFSHVLRDFRNYIHPYHQMSRNFLPDEHTAKICFQVLKAALFQISTNVK